MHSLGYMLLHETATSEIDLCSCPLYTAQVTSTQRLSLSLLSILSLLSQHCVFGIVTAGHEVVRAIEAVGSRQGPTSQRVVIDDCGVL